MLTPDLINGSFEFLGAILTWQNVQVIRRDKQFRGVSIWPMIFFTLWGLWNIVYYPVLHQIFSLFGALNLAIANLTYVGLMLKYRKA